MDKLFKVEVLRQMQNPQQVIAAAMHQDYSEDAVIDEIENGSFLPTEKQSGDMIVKRLLSGGRGHYGVLEAPQIVFNICNFPHSVMQQLRTHRVGVSFDVQSGRYTGKRFLSAHDAIGMLDLGHKPDIEEIERVFYIRPVGFYSDRQGKKYKVTQEDRLEDIEWCWDAICNYKKRINQGWAEEHARSMIPFDFRQHFVMSCNVRSLMHILDLRLKKDAQEECQQCCELMYPHFEKWVPQIAEWYTKNRKLKGMLAP